MTKNVRQIDRIFGVLESGGFPRALQETLLPSWVTAQVLNDDAAVNEVAAILANRLGLRASSLFGPDPSVEVLRRRDTKYKRSLPTKSKDLTAATTIAIHVAECVSTACKLEYKPLTGDAVTIRNETLASFPGNWLGLRNLIMMCWSRGIPVVNLANLGSGVSKMDGMIVQAADRPIIVLSKASQLWAWQLFVLAHEIGHIALNHVAQGEVLVDEELGETSYALEDSDPEERDADAFAIALLNGRPGATYTTSKPDTNAPELAEAAFTFGKKNKVDPGHIALNFAYRSKNWPTGVAAARILQGQQPAAQIVINEAMWGGIDQEALPPDAIEFLGWVTKSRGD